jgi:hypothetical protein
MLPQEYTVVFFAGASPKSGSQFMLEEKAVILARNLTSPRSLLTLFHEVGHAQEYAQMTEREQEEHLRDLRALDRYAASEEVMSRILRRERNAWSYALAQLRPFLKRDGSGLIDKRQALSFVHDHALRRYSAFFRGQRKQNRQTEIEEEKATRVQAEIERLAAQMHQELDQIFDESQDDA